MHETERDGAIDQRLAVLAGHGGWELPVAEDGRALGGAALDEYIDRRADDHLRRTVELGLALALKKRELPHGAFGPWLEARNISARTAREAMRLAARMAEVQAATAERLAELPARKLAPLLSLPAPALDELASDGLLDDAGRMSREQIREVVALRKELEAERARSERADGVVAELEREVANLRARPEPARRVAALRATALEAVAAARAELDALAEVAAGLDALPEDTPARELDAVIHPLAWALQGVAARAAVLLDDLIRRHPEHGLRHDVTILPPLLEQGEAELLRQRLAAADERAALRRAAHEAAGEGKRKGGRS